MKLDIGNGFEHVQYEADHELSEGAIPPSHTPK